jgi:Spy/CpxP family protein refolding chaperone
MFRASLFALASSLIVLAAGGLSGQEAKAPKEETKVKGFLPQNWAKIGLTDDQKQAIYKIQAKYGSDIDKLEAKVKELKGTRDQVMKGVLSADQKKKLEEILTGKAK